MSRGMVLFVDDEPAVRAAAVQSLELAGLSARACAEAAEALALVGRDFAGVVVSDVRMPRMDGMALLRRVREVDPELPVVLVTGHGDVPMAVEAMRAGAWDFIEKPYRSEHLVEVVRRALEKRALVLENRALRAELAAAGEGPVLLGRSEAMRRLRETVAAVAATEADVLVIGETGSGKEVVARTLHRQSARRGGRFVAVNCGALPESIIESELFGHEAGAFTGARERRIGRFEYASGGTLLLDEIESMPPPLQVRLLRVLQERAVERLGGNEPVPVDVRVVAATKEDLLAAAREGRFREDLYYRLDVVRIVVPPLRERREDIPLLFHHFAAEAAARHGREPREPDPATVARLMAHDWPGNVRELRNAAERWVLGLEGAEGGPRGLAERVEAFERALLADALRRHRGDIGAVCAELALPRKTLYDKLRRHGLRRRDFTDG
ncbi:sigma-54-dependent transcriptional regulator [Inmirania thermothiophila]|uniref:Two-component system C4-dicarboxylate transport response regulator DctD n=1 Tax=Inmirania thermothiophila TaxID=1750597 RepID=A0A3N1YA89_9GAMM|nr:sigma-54 dependent transcriptional regulator [Inmirania thermothiophila]ROR34542.1 two-component system C4-dicarboxylate transport response regulator DctD [Inmirania thermothiophila]